MNQELHDVLYSHYLERKRHFGFKMDEYVFGGEEPLADTTITSKKNEYCNLAKVEQIRIHDFRHPYVKPTTKKFITFFEVFRAAS